MGVFDFLPIHNQCCFCINLKIGSTLIAVWAILSVGGFAYYTAYPVCETNEGIGRLTIVKYTRPIAYFGDAVLLISAIIFIIGVVIQKSITAEIFLFGIAILLVAYILYSIVGVFISLLNEECRDFASPLIFTLNMLIWIYFMIIIRSFKEEM